MTVGQVTYAGAILVVDSNPEALRVIAAILSRTGYEVITFSSNLEATRVILDGVRPDLLITGLVFAESDGLALAREARASCPGLPVLLVPSGAEDLPTGLRNDGIRVLPKPFLPQELRQAVASALAESPWDIPSRKRAPGA